MHPNRVHLTPHLYPIRVLVFFARRRAVRSESERVKSPEIPLGTCGGQMYPQ